MAHHSTETRIRVFALSGQDLTDTLSHTLSLAMWWCMVQSGSAGIIWYCYCCWSQCAVTQTLKTDEWPLTHNMVPDDCSTRQNTSGNKSGASKQHPLKMYLSINTDFLALNIQHYSVCDSSKNSYSFSSWVNTPEREDWKKKMSRSHCQPSTRNFFTLPLLDLNIRSF